MLRLNSVGSYKLLICIKFETAEREALVIRSSASRISIVRIIFLLGNKGCSGATAVRQPRHVKKGERLYYTVVEVGFGLPLWFIRVITTGRLSNFFGCSACHDDVYDIKVYNFEGRLFIIVHRICSFLF